MAGTRHMAFAVLSALCSHSVYGSEYEYVARYLQLFCALAVGLALHVESSVYLVVEVCRAGVLVLLLVVVLVLALCSGTAHGGVVLVVAVVLGTPCSQLLRVAVDMTALRSGTVDNDCNHG